MLTVPMALTATAAPDPAKIDHFLSNNLERTHLPGVAAVVVTRDRVTYLRGHGRDGLGRPIGPDTPFRIGSLSKSFTAFAVMQLVERRLVDLDAPAYRYIPELGSATAAMRRITVRQLLNQTSGLNDRAFPEMSRPQPRTLADAALRLSDVEPAAAPGAQWNYHNPNYHLLARLVEAVSGKPFAAYLRDEILLPIGMRNSGTALSAQDPTLAVPPGYVSVLGVLRPRDPPQHFVAGSGGMVSTARDLGMWLQLHLNDGVTADGRRLISSEGLRQMHEPSGGVAGDYAFGWSTKTLPDGLTRSQHGGALFSYSADQAIYSNGDGYAVLINSAAPGGPAQASFVEGMGALMTGKPPEFGAPLGDYIDYGLVALAVIAGGLAVFQVRRAAKWGRWWARRPIALMAPRLVLGLAPLLILVKTPWLLGALFGGRDVSWPALIYAWPALIAAVLVPAVGAVVILWARLLTIGAVRRSDPTP